MINDLKQKIQNEFFQSKKIKLKNNSTDKDANMDIELICIVNKLIINVGLSRISIKDHCSYNPGLLWQKKAEAALKLSNEKKNKIVWK